MVTQSFCCLAPKRSSNHSFECFLMGFGCFTPTSSHSPNIPVRLLYIPLRCECPCLLVLWVSVLNCDGLVTCLRSLMTTAGRHQWPYIIQYRQRTDGKTSTELNISEKTKQKQKKNPLLFLLTKIPVNWNWRLCQMRLRLILLATNTPCELGMKLRMNICNITWTVEDLFLI